MAHTTTKTTTTSEATPPFILSNAQRDTLVTAAQAARSEAKAGDKTVKLAAAMAAAGWKVDWLAPKTSPNFALIRDVAAEATMTAKEFATYSDSSLAIKVKDGDGRVLTARGKLVHRTEQAIRRLRSALSAPATRTAKTLAERLAGQATAALKAIESNRTGETPEFGDAVRKVLVAAFQTISDTLDPQKAK
jgi:hypothetical protein